MHLRVYKISLFCLILCNYFYCSQHGNPNPLLVPCSSTPPPKLFSPFTTRSKQQRKPILPLPVPSNQQHLNSFEEFALQTLQNFQLIAQQQARFKKFQLIVQQRVAANSSRDGFEPLTGNEINELMVTPRPPNKQLNEFMTEQHAQKYAAANGSYVPKELERSVPAAPSQMAARMIPPRSNWKLCLSSRTSVAFGPSAPNGSGSTAAPPVKLAAGILPRKDQNSQLRRIITL